MAEERVRHDYSGRPIPALSELDWDNPGEYEGGREQVKTRDGRWVEEVDGQWYLVDDDWQPMMDSPVDADQVVQ